MAKGFGKFLAGVVIAGAAAAGVYYLLKAKEDEDDFDDFDDDVNDDLEDFLKDETSKDDKSKREYVPLNFSKEAAANTADSASVSDIKETASDIGKSVGEAVKNTADEAGKIIGNPEKAADKIDNVVKEAGKAAEKASEFKFTDLTDK